MEDAVYEDLGDGRVVAGELARGPWDPQAQHGGAPAAMLMRAFESVDASAAAGPGELGISRVTYELLRPVPLGELRISAEVVRPGRRVQLLEGSISTVNGVEVVRARALRVARAQVSAGEDANASPAAGPQAGRPSDFADPGHRTFPGDAMEIRFVAGKFYEPGPATAWFRLRVPLVADEEPTGLQRLAAAADFPNGIATELSWDQWLFINPDLSIHIEREPVGEWICLDARMRVPDGGVGQSEAVLYDRSGRVGRSLQSLFIAPRN
jgi:acyl-coenzyme A thioesterase PaaI-like protein